MLIDHQVIPRDIQTARRVQKARWLARTLAMVGLLPVLGSLLLLAWNVEMLLLFVLSVVSLCAVCLAWKTESIGGALLTTSSLILGLVVFMTQKGIAGDTLFWLVAPHCLSGVLFMLCWFWDSGRATKSNVPLAQASLIAAHFNLER